MYREQKKAFQHLMVPEWVSARSQESLAEYSQRLLEVIQPPEAYYLGGCSFGGMIAFEMALRRPPLGLLLLSSTRSPINLRPRMKRVSRISRVTSLLPWYSEALLAELGLLLTDGVLPFRLHVMLKHLHLEQVDLVRWGVEAVLRWQPSSNQAPCPIHQIHGECDPFLTPHQPDTQIVPQAGHLLTKTHSPVVNQFIRDRLDRMASIPSEVTDV